MSAARDPVEGSPHMLRELGGGGWKQKGFLLLRRCGI